MSPGPAISVAARLVRVLAPKWASDPLSGGGAAANGGRFNDKGQPALYLSYDLDVAANEYNQDLGVRPGTFCYYDADLSPIVDLTSAAVLTALGIDRADLFASWKDPLSRSLVPPSWIVARKLSRAGYAGAQYESVVPANRSPPRGTTGVNLVVWDWSGAPGRRLAPLDPRSDLPRDRTSWPSP